MQEALGEIRRIPQGFSPFLSAWAGMPRGRVSCIGSKMFVRRLSLLRLAYEIALLATALASSLSIRPAVNNFTMPSISSD
jgi:hypothetical protein